MAPAQEDQLLSSLGGEEPEGRNQVKLVPAASPAPVFRHILAVKS